MVHHKCECGVKASSQSALLSHWNEEYEKGNNHFHCKECLQFFYTPQALKTHNTKFHPVIQHLLCPGCNEDFAGPGGLLDHIERNFCPRISHSALFARREEYLAFARELQRRKDGGDPGKPEHFLKTVPTADHRNYSRFLSPTQDGEYGSPSLSSLRQTNVTSIGRPNPLSFNMREADPQLPAPQFRSDEFPPVGNETKQKVSSTPASGNPWAQKKNLFPDAPPASRPTPAQLSSIREPARNNDNAWPDHDPRNPKWDPQRFFVTWIGKYKCPVNRCPKSFDSVVGLRNHLLSPTHSLVFKVQCPMCMGWFNSTSALIQHGESLLAKCGLRRSDGYRNLLHQATAGIIDVDGEYEDGTPRYMVTEKARREWGGGGASDSKGVRGLEQGVKSLQLNDEKSEPKKVCYADLKTVEEDDDWKEPAAFW